MGDMPICRLSTWTRSEITNLMLPKPILPKLKQGLTNAQAAYELEKVEQLKAIVEEQRRIVKQCELDRTRLNQIAA